MRLTTREKEVLRLAALGLGNKEIAQQLDHSYNTTRALLRKVFRKLKAATRVEAVAAAEKGGLLRADA
ncbi:MAG TPA: LuxR C-terminal-related transcriptional regulator [Planctomycetota bacterium]|nr:LuxR C-terminal-related transcriptional regulator [Planctomycetota bacterium]